MRRQRHDGDGDDDDDVYSDEVGPVGGVVDLTKDEAKPSKRRRAGPNDVIDVDSFGAPRSRPGAPSGSRRGAVIDLSASPLVAERSVRPVPPSAAAFTRVPYRSPVPPPLPHPALVR